MPAPRPVRYRLEFRPYRRPFRRPLVTARGNWAVREGVIVRLTDPAGRVGYGEAAPVPGFTGETAAADLSWLCRADKVVSVGELNRVPAGLAALRWALECAREMLEGKQPQPAGSRALPVAALLPSGRAALGALAKSRAEGYRTFKWKVAAGAAVKELALLEKLLEALPPGGQLRLDANGGLDEREWAVWGDGLRALGKATRAIEFFEQPWPLASDAGEWRRAARRAENAPVPVALDESVAGLAALRAAGVARWPGWLVVKPSLLGDGAGFRRWRAPARPQLVYSSAFETSVGLHAALALAASDAHAGEHAIGFGGLAAFPDDGLQLPQHAASSRLRAEALGPDDFSEIWNRLSSPA